MVKKITALFFVINISFVYPIIGGLGVNIVNDSFTIDGETFNVPGDIGDVTRTDIGAPFGLGVFTYLTIVPFVDFEASVNFTVSPYDYTFTNSLGDNKTQTLGFGKMSWSLSAQKPILKIPTIRVYLGGGINSASHTKVVTLETMKNLDIDQLHEINYINDKLGVSSTGFHIEFGARFKPPIIPFSINANARYNFIEDVVPNEDGFMTVSIGMAFAI